MSTSTMAAAAQEVKPVTVAPVRAMKRVHEKDGQKPLALPHTKFFLDAPSRKNLLIFLCMAEVSKIIP